MKLAILKVILWPRNQKFAPRVIQFEPGKINIVTGESAAGKSSLTWIIDYCLGSAKCSIPVGLIRDVTEWFGLHLQLANTQMIVARRNPEDQQSTSDLYWIEGVELSVPQRVEKNARVDDLKNRFNQISHLPSLDFAGEETNSFNARASFRDMAAFNFQPQHIVANPYTLFFKADTTEHRERLRIIFPMVLGAIDASTLAKQREVKDAEREHDRLKGELESRLAAARVWAAEVETYYMQARTYGLLPNSPTPSPSWSLDKYILELQNVPNNVRTMDLPGIEQGTSETAVTELGNLVKEEDNRSRAVGSLRRRLHGLTQLSSSLNEYGVALTGYEDRVQGVGWLSEKIGDAHQCPVCSAVHADGNPRLVELKQLAEELKSLTSSVQEAPAKLDTELATLRQELRDQEDALSKVRQKRQYLEGASAEETAQRQKVRQIYLFVGRVEQAIANVAASENVSELRERVQSLALRIAEMKAELDPRKQKEKLDAALGAVSLKIAEFAKLLELEHSDTAIRLNIRELSLQFARLTGRSDFLWEVGSGQNWVGYHVAGLLALHEHFGKLPSNHVPNFLVIDQPSQVYFPEAWPSLEALPAEKKGSTTSSDIAGVRRIFLALSHFLDDVDNEFQVIVTEHAGSITWDNVPHVHLVGNWRNGHDEFLIPATWLTTK